MSGCQCLCTQMSHVQYATLWNNTMVVVAAEAATTAQWHCHNIMNESNNATVAIFMEKKWNNNATVTAMRVSLLFSDFSW